MKTKQLIYAFSITALVMLSVLYACEKNEASTLETEQSSGPKQNLVSNNAARSSGSRVFYSAKKDSTVYYKMDLSWSSGVVTVNRTIVTSGYPAGTHFGLFIDNDIDITEYHNSDPQFLDSVRVHTHNTSKQFYFITFEPGANGGYYNSLNNGGDHCLKCENINCAGQSPTGWGDKCRIKQGSNRSFYCWGCKSCDIRNCYVGVDLVIPDGGGVLVEATGVTITN